MKVALRCEPAGADLALFALDGDTVVGSAVLRTRPLQRRSRASYPDVPELAYLQVEPNARGRGIGTALIGYAEQLVRDGHGSALVLGVSEDNPRAGALYARLGFRPTGVVDSYDYMALLPDGRTAQLAETCELMRKVLRPLPADRVAVCAAARRIAASRGGQTRWVGVDGRGASGKSTLAAEIAAVVPDAVVVHIDDFAGPRIKEWDWARFDTQVVQPLTSGRRAHYQRWDWDSDAGAEWHEIRPGAVVVVEGVSCTRREVMAPWALTVWVEASRETRLQRARERDGEAMLARWLEDWMPSEDAYVARERPQDRIDLIVSSERL